MTFQLIFTASAKTIDKNDKICLDGLKTDSTEFRICKCNLVVEESNFYIIKIKFVPSLVCPVATLSLSLINAKTEAILASGEAMSCHAGKILYEGVLEAGTELALIARSNVRINDVNINLTIDKDQAKYDQILQLAKTTAFDKALEIQYITNQPLDNQPPAPPFKPQYPPPPAPQVYPWTTNIIPWGQRQANNPPPGTVFPNNNYYEKFQSIQYSVFFYLGIDMFTVQPNSPDITIFIKNFQDRGFQNYLKKVYMDAITCDKMQFYTEKIDGFLNEVYSKIVINQEPVLSAFKNVLIRFFLDIHIGTADYPAFVIEYFQTFVDIIGFGDPDRPGRDEAYLRGNSLAPAVKEYFRERNIIVVANEDKSSIAYWWDLAGLPIESLLIESVHNIIAFSQYNNTLFRLIADKLWAATGPTSPASLYGFPPTPPPPPGPPAPRGNIPVWYPFPPIPFKTTITLPPPLPPLTFNVGPVNFFEKLTSAPTNADKLNVVREAFRILSPNTNAFSRLRPEGPDGPAVQARHIWQQISILNQGIPGIPIVPPSQLPQNLRTALYFFYNPNQYNAQFRTSVIDDCNPPPPPPISASVNPADNFEIFPQDNNPALGDGMVIEKANPKLFPMFQRPTYLPFGQLYRRCAGETLNYFLVQKLIARFADLEWEVRPIPLPPDFTRYVTLAPFTAVPDNIFVKQPDFN